MRRTALLLGLLVATCVTPAGAAPVDDVYVVDHLFADWVHRPTPAERAHWYAVEADIVTDARTGQIVSSRARAGVGPCRRGMCGISPFRTFEVVSYEPDALLQSARLVLRRGDQVARVTFSIGPTGGMAADSIHPCPGAADAYSSLSRSARASGVVFGRRVSSASDWDRIAESVQREIYAC
jgi:hypothetical protein